MTSAGLPRVAVVGRPNVGKSTLVNRLAARKKSIVGPTPGLTRDRLDTEVEWGGRRFILFDTGGLVQDALAGDDSRTVTGKVAAKALETIEGSDLVVFVADAVSGVTSDDLALAKRLRRHASPVLLAVNKVDDTPREAAASEFWALGIGEPMPVSAVHGRGTGDLLDLIVSFLPEESPLEDDEDIASIALVGRPNVGKSSVFNRLAGEERSIVDHHPGTTRDSIDTIVRINDATYRFIDTAGLRRRAKTRGVEIASGSRTRAAIERSQLAILLVDAAEGATVQDQRIARQVAEAGVGALIALNKWDLVQGPEAAKAVEASMKDRLHFIDYAPMVRTSATTKRGLEKLVANIEPILAARKDRVSTGRLNQLVTDTQQKMAPPRQRNQNVRVLYATQASTAPPTFVLFSTGTLAVSWLRFLERRIREEFGFLGNPIRLVTRERKKRSREGGPGISVTG